MHRRGSRSPGRRGFQGSSQRIDRHECRRKAVEFLMTWDDSRSYSEEDVDRVIARFVRQRPNGWDSLSYAAEILYGLLGPKRGLLIADRWIMGILAEDIQRTLGPGELSVLRWAAFELLNHPHIPTTVIINEANNIAKMFCPQAAALVHVAVNRMIETQQTIGAEVATGALPILPSARGGAAAAPTDPHKPHKQRFPDLDPQAQLALMLLDQQRKMRRQAAQQAQAAGAEGEGQELEAELPWLEAENIRILDLQSQTAGHRGKHVPRMVEAVRKNAETQTEAAASLLVQ